MGSFAPQMIPILSCSARSMEGGILALLRRHALHRMCSRYKSKNNCSTCQASMRLPFPCPLRCRDSISASMGTVCTHSTSFRVPHSRHLYPACCSIHTRTFFHRSVAYRCWYSRCTSFMIRTGTRHSCGCQTTWNITLMWQITRTNPPLWRQGSRKANFLQDHIYFWTYCT